MAAVQEGVDAANAKLAKVEQIKRFTIIEGDWLPGRRRAHPDDEAQAQADRREVHDRDRGDVHGLIAARVRMRAAPTLSRVDEASPPRQRRCAAGAGEEPEAAPSRATERDAGRASASRGVAYAVLSSAIVPALPTIQHELHVSETDVTWLLTAYLLSASVATSILGRLGDMYGKERLLLSRW